MEINKLKEINEKILEKATSKIEKAHTLDSYDCECMEAMSMAIDNIKDLMKIEKYKSQKEMKHEPGEVGVHKNRMKTGEEESEFTKCIYEILEKHGEDGAIGGIIVILDESMNEIKILHKRMYDRIMSRLKEMK